MNTHMKHHSMLLCLVDPNGLRSNSKISQNDQIPNQTKNKYQNRKKNSQNTKKKKRIKSIKEHESVKKTTPNATTTCRFHWIGACPASTSSVIGMEKQRVSSHTHTHTKRMIEWEKQHQVVSKHKIWICLKWKMRDCGAPKHPRTDTFMHTRTNTQAMRSCARRSFSD